MHYKLQDTVGEDRCYKRAGTFEVSVTYCTCTKDECNGAPQTGTGSSFLSMMLLAVTVSYLSHLQQLNFPILGFRINN